MTSKAQLWDTMGKSQNAIEDTSWDTLGRGGTLWDTLAGENSLTNATFMEIPKRCKYCGRTFIAHKMTTIYCSPSCNNKDYKRAIRQKQIAEYYEAHPEDKEDTPKDVLHGKAFLTPREAAKVLGIGKSSVYMLVKGRMAVEPRMYTLPLIPPGCGTPGACGHRCR